MTIPADVLQSVWDSLTSTINELQDLPDFTIPNKQILNQSLTSLDDVLSKCTYESWTAAEANFILQSLGDALQKTSSLASKWKKRRIRLVLDKSTFVSDMSNAVMEIQKSCGKLQARQNHREAARAIGEQLGIVVQGLGDGGSGSELNTAEADFKKEFLDFLRANNSKSKTSEDVISVISWLAKHLGTEVHSIKHELQDMKKNADTVFNTKREMDAELLEQLILSLIELEGESATLAKTKANLICSLCGSLMKCPVIIDSGLSFCKICVEENFRCGYKFPDTDVTISEHFVVNVTLQNVVACFGVAEEQPAAEPFTEEGESSDANLDCHVLDEPLERKAQIGLEYLDSSSYQKVLAGFNRLIKCASLPGGPLAVFNARFIRPPPAPPIEVIPTVIEKAQKKDPNFSKLAVKLMARLTSDTRGASANSGRPNSEIILEVADALDVLVSLMKEESLTRTRVLAAETVANILVNKEVRTMVRSHEGIVPVLVALSNVDTANAKEQLLQKAITVGLKGLQRLAECSKRGDNNQKIVSALIKLLKKGLSYQPELTSLVRDSLVALENQILAIDHATPTNEVCKVVWEERSDLMVIKGNAVSHTSVPGRMAIINIMTKLCGLYKEGIDKHVFLYLLKMIKSTRSDLVSLLGPSQAGPQERIVAEQLKDLTEVLLRSVRLLCFCVAHGKNTAQSVLSENFEERSSLEELLVHEETSGIFDESRLEILSILDLIVTQRTQATLVKILIELSKSKNQICRQQVARKLRILVEEKHELTEFKHAGGIVALVALLKDPDLNCRQDALVTLQALPRSMAIPVGQFPLQTILDFLIHKGHIDVTNAAVGLFDLMVRDNAAISAGMFLKTEGALEATLNFLDREPDSPGSQKCASVLLEMAKDHSVRIRIADPSLRGLDILVKYVRDHGRNEFKELLTATLVLFCRDGETSQVAVIEADGHRFLLISLQEKICKEIAAEGLLELIKNINTTEKILESGFVATALGSIDGEFACKDIALGLARLSSIDEGLNQIYSEPCSVSALLMLLDYCPDRLGKDAAASTIARLYPLLHRQADLTRLSKIEEKCYLLLNLLDRDDIKEVLQALAAIAAETRGKRMIHQYRGHVTLLKHLSVTDTEIQGLVLKILSVMSSDETLNGVETYGAKMIRLTFMDIKVGEKLLTLVKSDEFSRRTESMKDALVLLRNLSLAGSNALAEGAVNVLLDVLKRHEISLPIVTELAVKALERFLDEPRGKQTFLRGGGIKHLVDILKVDAFARAGDGLVRASVSSVTIILTAIAKDPHNRRAACEAIYECDILPALNGIIFYGETNRIKWQAAVLMKLLAMYGPTTRVCPAIKDKGCIDALIALRNVQHCKEIAMDVLKFVGEKNSRCKKYIDYSLEAVDTK